MTVLDLTLPSDPLLMIRDMNLPVSEPHLPEGYFLEPNPEKQSGPWIDLMMELGFFHSQKQAETVWDSFLENPDYKVHDCFSLILDKHGKLAAACAIWPGKDFQDDPLIPLRIHYVGVSPDHQKKGLAKSVLTCSLKKAQELDQKQIYLSTQAQSWPAVHLYQKAGFTPWKEQSSRHSKEENQKAWKEAQEAVFQKVQQPLLIKE